MANPQRLSALEATFLKLSSAEVPFVPGCVLQLDRPLAVDALQDRLTSLLVEIPRYRQRIARAPLVGSLAWVDDGAFEIERHVRAVCVPAPGGQRELDELVGSLLMMPLPTEHPPWRLWTVEGLAGGRGALIAVVHHALVDGVAGIGLLERMLQVVPGLPKRRSLPHPPPRPRPILERIIQRVEADVRGRTEAWRHLATELAPARHAPQLVELLRQGLQPASDLGLPAEISGERSFATLTFDLDAAKAIKRALHVTVNDVILACITGALRRFVARRGIDPTGLKDVRAMVPVSRHARDEHATSGNRVTLLLVPLPVDEHEPVAAVRRIARTTEALKRRDVAGAGDVLCAISDLTWSGVLANVFRVALWRRAFNLIVTNVPGPTIPLYLLDARITRLVPILNLWPHVPIGIAIGSYAGSIAISIDADRASLPDLAPLVHDLRAAFAELEATIPREEPPVEPAYQRTL